MGALLPFSLPLLLGVLVDKPIDAFLIGIKNNAITILDQSDWSAYLRLWDDMTCFRYSGIIFCATRAKDQPIMKPLLAPENRPSVINAVEFPNPAPIKAAVGPSISGIPGAPLGP